MLPLVRRAAGALKRRPVPGCLANLWLSLRWNATVSPRAIITRPWLLTLGHGAHVGACTLHCSGDGIVIGTGSFIHDTVLIDCQQGGVTIGPQTTINTFSAIYGAGGVHIGADCLVATGAVLVASSHRFDDPAVPIRLQGSDAKGIAIEDDVWIAAGVKVLDGVHIGRSTIVGAGAVVNRDLPSFTVAAGVPARVIRMRPGAAGSFEDAP